MAQGQWPYMPSVTLLSFIVSQPLYSSRLHAPQLPHAMSNAITTRWPTCMDSAQALHTCFAAFERQTRLYTCAEACQLMQVGCVRTLGAVQLHAHAAARIRLQLCLRARQDQ